MKAEMKELNMNEMEQVNGGNFIDDVKDVLKTIFPDPFAPGYPIPVKPVIARGKC